MEKEKTRGRQGVKNWRPFLFPYHGPGSVPQGLSSFHPAPPRLLCAAARPQPCALGGLCRGADQGLPPPCLGPPWDFERCGARKARNFCP
nr:MAG TPA: hypothetical protein [Caudoviricetes sp.]